MDNGRMELGNFNSSEGNNRRFLRERTYSYNSKNQRKKTHSIPHMLMPLKIGICVVICLLVVIANLIGVPIFNRLFNTADNTQEQQDDTGTLGKLRFVELPGLLEVFAGGENATAPISFKSAIVNEDKTILVLQGTGNATVTTCNTGIIKSIGYDEKMGLYVAVRHADDVETYYYGLKAVTVDESQPVGKLDTLGLLPDDGKLYVQVKINGEPKDPSEYLNIRATLGAV